MTRTSSCLLVRAHGPVFKLARVVALGYCAGPRRRVVAGNIISSWRKSLPRTVGPIRVGCSPLAAGRFRRSQRREWARTAPWSQPWCVCHCVAGAPVVSCVDCGQWVAGSAPSAPSQVNPIVFPLRRAHCGQGLRYPVRKLPGHRLGRGVAPPARLHWQLPGRVRCGSGPRPRPRRRGSVGGVMGEPAAGPCRLPSPGRLVVIVLPPAVGGPLHLGVSPAVGVRVGLLTPKTTGCLFALDARPQAVLTIRSAGRTVRRDTQGESQGHRPSFGWCPQPGPGCALRPGRGPR